MQLMNFLMPLLKQLRFTQVLPHAVIFPTEDRMWPEKLVDVYEQCDIVTFTNIHCLFQLALSQSITSCKSERSFGQQKLMKTSY